MAPRSTPPAAASKEPPAGTGAGSGFPLPAWRDPLKGGVSDGRDAQEVRCAADGTPRATLTGHDRAVNAVAISPDGTWLATGSSDRTARTWAADGTPRATLTGHDGPVNAVAISPDGTWLATGGDDRTARTWAADGTPWATLTGHTDSVFVVAISPDGTLLATASSDRTARIWKTDGRSGTSATAMRADGAFSGCAWFPGSTDLCIAGQRGLYRFTLLPPAG
jgi:WD40 repeat protein